MAVAAAAAASIADRKAICLATVTSQESQAVAEAVGAAVAASTAVRTVTCQETATNQRSPETLATAAVVAGPASTAAKMDTCLATVISPRNLGNPESRAPDLEEGPPSDLM